MNIEHYKKLREEFSTFSEDHLISSVKKNGPYHKPLMIALRSGNKLPDWIIPVVQNRPILYYDENEKLSKPVGRDN